MPRSPSKRGQEEAKPNENGTKSLHKVTFIKDTLLNSGSAEVVTLRNPHTDAATKYIIDKDDKKVYEIMAFDEGCRSWFLGQTIESNGKLYVITPMDVTYLILPYLMKSPKIVPLEHLLEDEEFPDLCCLDLVANGKDLSHVADSKGSPDLCAWQYVEQRALEWLAGRVGKLATLLHAKNVPTSTAQSLTYVVPFDPKQAKEAYTILAHGIISEYLPKTLSLSLQRHLGLPERQAKPKVLASVENKKNKKQKVEGPSEDYSKDYVTDGKGKTSLTAKEKALAKSAAGSKSIMSFFGKK